MMKWQEKSIKITKKARLLYWIYI